MRFRNPWVLLLLIPLCLAVVRAWFDMAAGKYSGRLSVPWKKLWGGTKAHSIMSPRFFPLVIYALSCAFLIVALARPQTSMSKIKRTIDGIDIMMVLDLSASMRIEDFRDQSRLETARPIIRDFVAGRPNDKVGFLTFSGEAVTMVPPTLDHSLVMQALKVADIGDLKDGTAIGDALATAVSRLKSSVARSRIIVLLTDGDNNVGQVDPLTAGELAKGFGIKVYSIAIGREGRVAMPFIQKDIFGRQVKTYQYFDNSINPDLLRQVSTTTGGKLYRVQDDPQLLRDVFKDIDALEKTRIESTEQVHFNEEFAPFVYYALLLFLGAFLLQNWAIRVYP